MFDFFSPWTKILITYHYLQGWMRPSPIVLPSSRGFIEANETGVGGTVDG